VRADSTIGGAIVAQPERDWRSARAVGGASEARPEKEGEGRESP